MGNWPELRAIGRDVAAIGRDVADMRALLLRRCTCPACRRARAITGGEPTTRAEERTPEPAVNAYPDAPICGPVGPNRAGAWDPVCDLTAAGLCSFPACACLGT